MSHTENNKRVLKNTMFLYIRMFVTLVVGLYTSRKVLEYLGVVDFGLYNVVGGVVAMFTFISSTMTNASHRFFAYALGTDNLDEQKKVFQTMWFVYLIVMLIVFVFAETLGLWFVTTRLNVPPDRVYAVKIVYQLSVFALLANFVRIPFNALVVAHENMNFFAYLSIVETVLKLAIVFALGMGGFDKLILYGVLSLVVVAVVSLAYIIYCKRNFKECIIKINSDWKKLKEIFSFSGWNFFSTMGDVALDQGVNISLNVFFNPMINAARAVAFQVRSQVRAFTGNFQMAATPQITKYYASGDREGFISLVNKSSKISFFLMFVIAAPLMLAIDPLLEIWLVQVPEYTSLFVKLILVNILVDALAGTLHFAILASGKIKHYILILSVVKLVCFLLMLLSFAFLGAGVEFSVYYTILFSWGSLILQIYFYSKLNDVSFFNYVKSVVVRALLVVVLSVVCMGLLLLNIDFDEGRWMKFILAMVFFLISCLFVFLFGLEKNERIQLLSFFKSKMRK